MTAGDDSIESRMFDAISAMMLDMRAAIARKDYEDRRRRQAQVRDAAKSKEIYKGRPADVERNVTIVKMLSDGQSWNSIMKGVGCSRSTLRRIA